MQIVWLLYTDAGKGEIESVQKQFAMFALREYPNANNNITIPRYSSRLNRLEILPLLRRRIDTSMRFVYDLFNDNIHCPRRKHEIVRDENPRGLRQTSIRASKLAE